MNTDYLPDHGPRPFFRASMEGKPSSTLIQPVPRKIIPTEFTSLDTAINYLNGHFMAEEIGFTLNTSVTINLNAAPGFDGATVRQQREFLTKLMQSTSSWVKRRTGKDCYWAWFLENEAKRGLHLHLHLCLPRQHHSALREFLKNQRDLNGPCWRAPVWISGGEDHPSPYQMASKRAYLLKTLKPDGIAPDGRTAFLPLHVTTEKGLPVEGCRCRLSNNISRKARAAAGWREITDLAELDVRLPIKPGVDWWDRLRRRDKIKAGLVGGSHHV